MTAGAQSSSGTSKARGFCSLADAVFHENPVLPVSRVYFGGMALLRNTF
jgi:hypothetical protein